MHSVIGSADPTLKPILTKWHKDFKHLISDFTDSSELQQRYECETSHRKLMKSFQKEADRPFQFKEAYQKKAVPLDAFDSHWTAEQTYDVAKSWTLLRMKHAQECQEFIVKHNAAAVRFFEGRLAANVVNKSLSD